MSKTLVVVLSDPKTGTEEAMGRLFNALFVVYELKSKQQEVALVFQGTGVRWASEIVKPSHPAHGLYVAVKDRVVAVCGGCADAFGATQEIEAAGLSMNREFAIPGTSGVVDLTLYLEQGYQVVTF